MIADFPNLGTRWSEFLHTSEVGAGYGGFLSSKGVAYRVVNNTIWSMSPNVSGSWVPIYSFSSVGSYSGRLFQSCIHDDWVYMAMAGRSGTSLVVNLRAYNVVTGAAVTILNAAGTLAYTPYSTTSCLAFGDVSVDPVTKIGVCCVGVSFTGTYEVITYGGGETWYNYYDYYGTYYRLFTFTAGTKTTNPAAANSITILASSAAADRKTGYGAVGAYNGTGIVYDKTAAATTFKTINTLATPSVGATVRSGYTIAHAITGPMIFMDSGSGQILRDQAGRTWDLTSLGGAAWYHQVDIIGEDSTNWYVTTGEKNAIGGFVISFLKLAKAGTTVTLLDSYETGSATTYYPLFASATYWNRMPFPESTNRFPIQSFQYIRGVQDFAYSLRLPIAEIG